MHNKLYTLPILKDLYQRATYEWEAYEHWRNLPDPECALQYYTKCVALVELMENIYTFDIGMGASGSSRDLKSRLDSFKKV